MTDPFQFTYTAVPTHADFALGAARDLGGALTELGVTRVLFIASEAGMDRYSAIHEASGHRVVARFDGVRPHCPEPVVEAAVAAYRQADADGVISVGGGSTLGLGKILKAEHGARVLALPTTYSGSEVTPIYGRKIGGEKRTRIDRAAIPDRVVYDPELTLSLPARQTAATGMNSLAHAVEALYPAQPNPVAAMLAREAIGRHARALPRATADGNDLQARTDALYAGFLGGLLVSMVGVALHHALGHVLGGLFDIDHGDYNSAVLSHVAAYNAPAVPGLAEAITGPLGGTDPGEALFDFTARIGAPRNLADLGMPAGGVAAAAKAILAKAPRNPRPLSADGMHRLIGAAHAGTRPSIAMYAGD